MKIENVVAFGNFLLLNRITIMLLYARHQIMNFLVAIIRKKGNKMFTSYTIQFRFRSNISSDIRQNPILARCQKMPSSASIQCIDMHATTDQ